MDSAKLQALLTAAIEASIRKAEPAHNTIDRDAKDERAAGAIRLLAEGLLGSSAHHHKEVTLPQRYEDYKDGMEPEREGKWIRADEIKSRLIAIGITVFEEP